MHGAEDEITWEQDQLLLHLFLSIPLKIDNRKQESSWFADGVTFSMTTYFLENKTKKYLVQYSNENQKSFSCVQ